MSKAISTSMATLLRHTDRLDRIDSRIGQLGQQAARLLEREQAARTSAGELEAALRQAPGRFRKTRLTRTLSRRQRREQQMRARREALVAQDLRVILLALERQSRRTREQLDHELERLAPVQAEWERLQAAFGTLEQMVEAPALVQLAGQWQGTLGIPEFPVRERDGYVKPFPEQALLF